MASSTGRSTTSGRSTGARRLDDGRDNKTKKGGLWWLWALLALLLIGLLLFFLLRGGDDDDTAANATPTPQVATPTPTPAETPAAATGGAAGPGSLAAAGTELLSAADSDIEGQVGEQATGTDVTVQEIVEGQGFWVGSSETDRRYVELGGDVGEDEQPSGDEQLAVGDKVDLEGEVRPAPQDPAQTLNLDDAGAELLSSQGAYVNATSVTKK